ncbi:protein-L-isoaspartate(D-aspartate) O-methyltransferase [Paraburkholderia sp. DHOC27]|uniref:protein-L-isoaspartate(D-aspartate) O-methyltransferase n=1 Tax=Paraburkholderia sp. DHOC27 TaxID=2303330 RepID=UPI000E3BEBFC|nr:protein-L-isoaspartate(D-aspartate) O-methyltransferase [Paraburkholderia sp. DHOC27]RFU47801.1 protein-L-isoaspartate(D-aspartate) O-methyltransferase [Paraburkholderia sp. DHOC27]
MTNGRAKRFPLGLEDLVREPRRPEGRPGEVRAANLAAAAEARANAARAKSPGRGGEGGAGRSVARDAGKAPSQNAAKTVGNVGVSSGLKPNVQSGGPAGGGKAAGVTAGSTSASKPAGTSSVKPAAPSAVKPTVTSGAKSLATSPVKPAIALATKPAAGAAARPSVTAPGHPKTQPKAQPLGPTSNQQANRPALTPVMTRPVASKSTERSATLNVAPMMAPNVALNGAQALTSERIRERMVDRLRANGITDQRVIHAMSVVPRHMFVDPGLATQAYEDAALPIGHHQTISKPSVVARMIELAAHGRPLANVLEIGTGCGYQAAVLSQVARDVYSIERIKPLYERAKTNLRPLRIPNIRLHYGDGRIGLPAVAPFDAIVIAAAGLDVPQALLEQLAIGGRLVAPVGAQDGQTQVLTLVERTGPAQWRESRLDRVFFVPLKSGVI